MRFPNPLIPGFNPDPSVVLADGVYHLVTSTFEYLPGIPVYRSTDLAPMTGQPLSCSVSGHLDAHRQRRTRPEQVWRPVSRPEHGQRRAPAALATTYTATRPGQAGGRDWPVTR